MSAVQDNPFDRNLDAFLGSRTPARGGAVSAARALVLVGHLPVLSGLWLSQFADREARERGAVCMLRIDADAVQLELFVANGRRPAIRPQATLAEALRAVAPTVSAWLVVPRHSESIDVPADATEIVVLTGADDPAVVAAYTLVKKCVESMTTRASLRGLPRARPRISVAVLGATEEECASVGQKLDKTTRAFLEVDLPVRGGLQRVSPVEGAFRGTFDAHAPLVDDVFAMIRAAEAAGAVDETRAEPSQRGDRTDRGERFTARRERVAPRRALVEPSPIPFHRGVPMQSIPVAPRAARTAPEAATATAPAPAARPAVVASLPPEPVTPVRARTVAGELPQQLVPELSGLTPLAIRAPRDKAIELALDGEGRLHVVGRAGDVGAMLRVVGWAREHHELLSLAEPRLAHAEPVIDLVVSDLRDARAIDGATVHVLTLVELGGRRGYLAQVAPA